MSEVLLHPTSLQKLGHLMGTLNCPHVHSKASNSTTQARIHWWSLDGKATRLKSDGLTLRWLSDLARVYSASVWNCETLRNQFSSSATLRVALKRNLQRHYRPGARELIWIRMSRGDGFGLLFDFSAGLPSGQICFRTSFPLLPWHYDSRKFLTSSLCLYNCEAKVSFSAFKHTESRYEPLVPTSQSLDTALMVGRTLIVGNWARSKWQHLWSDGTINFIVFQRSKAPQNDCKLVAKSCANPFAQKGEMIFRDNLYLINLSNRPEYYIIIIINIYS